MSDLDEVLKNPPPMRRRRHKIHQAHASKVVRNATINSNINVTPLVDVVLVLLIIFMVVTPLITRGMPVEQPMTRYHDKKNDSGEQIVVSVTCEGGKMGAVHWECGQTRTFVGAELANDDTLGDMVQKEMRLGTGNREVHVKADRKAPYGAVRHAMELINRSGVSTVALGSEEIMEN